MSGPVGAMAAFAEGPMGSTLVALLGALVLLPLVALLAVVCWFHGLFFLASACAVAIVFVVQSWDPAVVPMEPCFFCGVASVPLGGMLLVGALAAAGYGLLRRVRGGEVTAMAVVRAHLRFAVWSLVVLVLGAIVGRWLQAGLLPGARLEPFDVSLWHAEEPAPPESTLSYRARMLHDLVSRVLPGAAHSDVERLLGEDLWPGRESLLTYAVDPHPLQGLDQQLLVLEFDDDGCFRSARIELR